MKFSVLQVVRVIFLDYWKSTFAPPAGGLAAALALDLLLIGVAYRKLITKQGG
jgi:hypothetical protein